MIILELFSYKKIFLNDFFFIYISNEMNVNKFFLYSKLLINGYFYGFVLKLIFVLYWLRVFCDFFYLIWYKLLC